MPHAYEHDDSESNGCCSSASDDGYEWGEDVGRNLPKSKELLKQLSTGRWAFDCL